MDILIYIIAGFLSGAVGSLGVGGGGVLIVFLTLFLEYSRDEAAVMNLIFFIPIALLSVIIYLKQKQIDVKRAVGLALSGLLGSVLGVYLSGVIETSLLSKIFGGILISISIKTLFSKTPEKEK